MATTQAMSRAGTGKTAPVDAGPGALLEAVKALAPKISARADEIEQNRALPADLFEEIAATGVFRMILPRALGGAEFDLPDIIPVIAEFARADGSTGWNVFIGSELASVWQRFDPEVLAPIFEGPGEVMARAPLSPRGTAERVAGGFRLKGQWPLASGSYANQWVLVSALVTENGAPSLTPQGAPEIRICIVPAAETRIVPTWDAIGLRGTMSNDVAIDGVLVPHARTIPFGKEQADGPRIGRLPIWMALGPFHCAFVLGVARGAIDDLIALAQTKRPLLNPAIRMAEDALVQQRLGSLEVRLAAARAYVVAETQTAWGLAGAGEPAPPEARARFRAMMAHVHTECLAIASEVFTLEGSNVLYNASPLQRRFRDMRAACQHIVASTEIYRPLGALLLGEAPPELRGAL